MAPRRSLAQISLEPGAGEGACARGFVARESPGAPCYAARLHSVARRATRPITPHQENTIRSAGLPTPPGPRFSTWV